MITGELRKSTQTKMTVELSVIIPTYKPEDYVWECIDSVSGQTLDADRYEIIIVLNGSKEPYYSEIESYSSKLERKNLKLIYTETQGVSEARNVGMKESTGNYLLFIDDDDYVCENYFFSLLEKAEEETLVLSDNEFFEDKTRRILSNPRSNNFKSNYETKRILEFRKFYRIAWGKLIPRKLIGEVHFDKNIQPGEDTLFIMEILAKVRKIRTIQGGCFYYRRIRENSLIRPRKRFVDHWKLHSYQVLRHLLILPKKSNWAHKVIVIVSMLGIARYFLTSSLGMMRNKK